MNACSCQLIGVEKSRKEKEKRWRKKSKRRESREQ